jgi:DNA-binding response OmpR family regulator
MRMKRILIVEPSKSFAQFLNYIITRLGYEVYQVDSGSQVFEKIHDMMPDLIISETKLKDLSGIELCKRLKGERMFSSIPFVIISIDGTIKTRQDAHKAGCADYLTKPVTARAIHELTERHLPYDHKRYNIRAKMYVNAVIRDNVKSEEMETLNIGEGGLYVCTQEPRKVGTTLDIGLPLPSLEHPLELKGEVIYTTTDNRSSMPKGMGIKFLEMDKNTVTLLRHYMESYLSDYLPEPFPNEKDRPDKWRFPGIPRTAK